LNSLIAMKCSTTLVKHIFYSLVDKLDSNGELVIYVYKLKAPAHEFDVSYIRNKIKNLDCENANKVCTTIFKLARLETESKLKIKVPNAR
jgi:hypothetical protein